MVSLKHTFVTAKGDGTNTTLVRPSNWNEEHKHETSADAVVLGRAVGAGPGAVQELSMSAMFLSGMVMPYAGVTAPAGWFLCDGESLIRADNVALFTVIGTTYGPGSNPGSTFALPDMRGRVAGGPGNGLPVLGGVAGEPTHTHAVSILGATTGGPSHTATVDDSTQTRNVSNETHTHGFNVTGTTGVGASYQPTLAMNFIIKG